MARNKQALRRTAQATADGYENFIARVGMQTPNQHSASTYRANFTSRNRMLVEWSYRSSWIIGEAVDAIPDDMTRKGIRITSEIDAKDRGILESQLDELQIWDALNDVLKWSRLYGGAVGFIMIEGQAPMTPLRPETIGKGKFKGILPLDRWMINPVLTRRIKEMGPDLGKPEFYDVVTTATGIPAWRIHHSRLIRFDGVTLPFQQKMTENEWGMSVVERIWDRLTAFDSATVGAAQLVYKAHLRTYSVEKLREIIALGGPAFEALLKNIDLIRQFQSNEGMTLMDSRDKFETHQYSFSGLDDILSQFAEQISGAVGIPLVRLFGQSPKGFSTGDADLANYYDRVSSLQERRLRMPMRRILDIMHRSELGKPLPDDFTFEFNPLWQMSDAGANPNGKNWVGKDSTAIAGVNVDIGKSGNPLNLWGMELGWTVVELAAAQQVGRPIDTQKYDGMQLKWQMDNDEQVYVGDSALNLKGLVTLNGVPVNNAAKTWATSTPDEIRASINQVLSDAWAASGYSVVPRDLLIPPEQFALLSSIIVSSAGNQSLLTYLQTNTISYHQNGVPLNIRAVKWLKGRGVGNKDRMVAYTNDKKYVRYPLVPLQSVPIQYRGLYQIATYYGKLGAVEPVYKETISYVDGI